tara:strand:+ start:817 stop:996 length:180 start_codon:yes stop_codon:yes gene_type:complete
MQIICHGQGVEKVLSSQVWRKVARHQSRPAAGEQWRWDSLKAHLIDALLGALLEVLFVE